MKYKKPIVGLIAVVLLAGAAYALLGNPIVFSNNQRLRKAIVSVAAEQVALNEIVPFAWDAAYTFDPYESKAQIEETIGFRSAAVLENGINEGMVHLLFVRDDKVVASVLGYAENLGYRLDFPEKVLFSEHAVFNVSRTHGVVALSRAG